MKNLILGLIVLASSQVSALRAPTTYTGLLNKFHTQANTELADADLQSGEVFVSPLGIQLSLMPSSKCPPGVFCTAVMPEPIEFAVQNVVVHSTRCGDVIYTGTMDRRAEDGQLVTIEVTDNRRNTCETLVRLEPTVVKLKIEGVLRGRPAPLSEIHTFTGLPLTENF